MKWISHIKYLSSKLSTSYYMINSLKNVTSPYILRTMYFACFHVHLRYGLILWVGDPESIRIFRLQKKVIWLIGKWVDTPLVETFLKNLIYFHCHVYI